MKWLNTSIVVTVFFTTHAANHSVLFQPLSVLRRSILRTAVRMMKEPFYRYLCLVGLFQCTKPSFGFRAPSRQSCVCSGLKRLLDTSYLVEYVISVTHTLFGTFVLNCWFSMLGEIGIEWLELVVCTLNFLMVQERRWFSFMIRLTVLSVVWILLHAAYV